MIMIPLETLLAEFGQAMQHPELSTSDPTSDPIVQIMKDENGSTKPIVLLWSPLPPPPPTDETYKLVDCGREPNPESGWVAVGSIEYVENEEGVVINIDMDKVRDAYEESDKSPTGENPPFFLAYTSVTRETQTQSLSQGNGTIDFSNPSSMKFSGVQLGPALSETLEGAAGMYGDVLCYEGTITIDACEFPEIYSMHPLQGIQIPNVLVPMVSGEGYQSAVIREIDYSDIRNNIVTLTVGSRNNIDDPFGPPQPRFTQEKRGNIWEI